MIAIGMLGLIMAATFVLYRAAFSLGIATQYPMWIATGLLMPLTVLPSWVGPISWFLAPTWGFRALPEAALGGTPWPDMGMCVVAQRRATSSSAWLCLRAFEDVARANATLRLT